MAASIDIACPKCGHKSKAPATMQGKNVRCRICQAVFRATGGATIGSTDDSDEEIARNPYIMREENLAARCPFCALPLDPPDSRICLHCGYDMQKRKRVESKQTYETTAGDYFMYHIPTLACLFAIGVLLTIDFLALIFREDIMKDSWFEDIVKPGIIPLYVFLASLLGIVPCIRLIFWRLVRFTPPEKVVKKQAE